ncbi:MAG: 16S rRNA (uracil(1498)-N(3))-methyltransferase [Pseudoflavonifractor sp.]|nr:16S rRNA (uracil(1498)-N(3))-methyltransferase [Alloprevotella sp.]MCM1116502.1 16S rRNA (uracil(1498)-N(3))-methyltransferase [Pseudoflavonifractor sp.]
MIQFFAPDIAETLTLPESDSAHAVRVLRLRSGDAIRVIDGRGMAYECEIIDPHQRHTSVKILASTPQPLPWSHDLVVAVAPTKHLDRMEWLVEKAVETGVNRIIPILCRHSERRELKTARLEKIAQSAMKQSLKASLPAIDPLTPVEEVIAAFADHQRFIAYCDPSIPRRNLAREYCPLTSAIALIGPEGDFSPEEIGAALEREWAPVSLGPCRLRTETAALTALQTFHIIDQANSND